MKVLPLEPPNTVFTHLFDCPACGNCHGFNVIPGRGVPTWSYNNDPDRPTISPSLLVRGHLGADNYGTCHSFVTDGRIQYLSDCTHAMAGQTVDLPDFE